MSPGIEALDQTVVKLMDETKVPGVAVGILDGEAEYLRCYGITSVDNPLPVTPDTLFQIGSTTKTITALVLMQLVEQNKLDLDAPVRTYLPDLALADETVAANLTLRHCLNHTCGFDGDYFCDFGRGEDALARAVASMVDLEQVAPLGELWSYCNSGFYIAARVIEVVTGRTYEAVTREMVLDPLDMRMSFFFPEEAMTYRFAVGHATLEDVHVLRPWAVPRVVHGVGGLISSIKDNLAYARFWLGDGSAPDGSRLLSESGFRRMQEPLVPSQDDEGIGLSWHSYEIDGVRIVRHGGATNGQVSSFLFVPERQVALAVLTNAGRRDVLDGIVKVTLKEFLGLERKRPQPVESGTDQLQELTGTYETILTLATVTLENGRLLMDSDLKPEARSLSDERPPKLPPYPLALTDTGGFIITDGLLKGTVGDIVRRNGKIRWLRLGGRLLTRAS